MSERYDGQRIKEMFAAATRWLELNSEAIDSLNVFPVPDGDTGINMLFTMRASMQEAEKCAEGDASSIVKAMAWGALMGARGNSGVILSQVLWGLSRGVEGESTINGTSLARAMREAAAAAYKAVSKPVEGTILTVVREASDTSQEVSRRTSDLEEVLAATVTAAGESVARTPLLLPVLAEAGVVDAGGQGLLVILEGILKGLRNEPLGAPSPVENTHAISRVARTGGKDPEGHVYGYCTQFLIEGDGLDPASLRGKIDQMGESTVVVGDENMLRVHTHSFEPEAVISAARAMGRVSKIDIQDIDQQHQEIVGEQDALPIATVVVASGLGIMEVFTSLGATAIVPGGQTMNPSTQELLTAIESTSAPAVIVLPNNKNIVASARQAAALSRKRVEVVPTTSIPQGIASLLAFNLESSVDDNLATMEDVISGVRTLELTRAVRPARVNGLDVRAGEAIGLLDGELLASGPGPADVFRSLASIIGPQGYSLATVYCGADAAPAEREGLAQTLTRCFPGIDVGLMEGGQPHYDFIISLE